ncbi:hypothetical protein Bpfe_009531, partial [Biomphalaria pfeifferi]
FTGLRYDYSKSCQRGQTKTNRCAGVDLSTLWTQIRRLHQYSLLWQYSRSSQNLRFSWVMKPKGLPAYYQKYTEAYNIPVL